MVGEDGFRFRHLLVRDATYGALPKATRADLHERYAGWVERRGLELVERAEIVGYHLEQAVRYKEELGQSDPALAERAGIQLAAAGRTAAWRGDDRTAAGLLQRALELTRPMHLDVMTELDLAEALAQRDPERGATVAESAAARAHEAGDEADELLARVGAASHRSLFAEDPAIDEIERLARAALPLLERAGNHSGLAYIWSVLGSVVANFQGRNEDWAHAAERAIHHGRLAGHVRRDLFHLPAALMFGPRPADEAILTLDALLPDNPHPDPVLCRAVLLAMLGRSTEADEIARDFAARLRDLTGDDDAEFHLGLIAATCGRHQDAVTHLRRFCDLLEARGQRGYLSSFAPMLGRSLCELDRHDEAEPLAQLGRELGDVHDTACQALWRQVQARVEARRGRLAEAEQLAREAVAINERTDHLNGQGDALRDLAEILWVGGDVDQAEATLVQALERYEQKKNLAQAASGARPTRSAERRRGRFLAVAARGSFDSAEREALVLLTREAAHADRTDALVALEDRDAAEEEREERVEAGTLDRVVLHLLGQLAGRAGIAPRCGVRLALGVQPRVRGRSVHRGGGDELAVRVRHEDRDGAGRVRDHVVDDGLGSGEAHRPSLDRTRMTAVRKGLDEPPRWQVVLASAHARSPSSKDGSCGPGSSRNGGYSRVMNAA